MSTNADTAGDHTCGTDAITWPPTHTLPHLFHHYPSVPSFFQSRSPDEQRRHPSTTISLFSHHAHVHDHCIPDVPILHANSYHTIHMPTNILRRPTHSRTTAHTTYTQQHSNTASPHTCFTMPYTIPLTFRLTHHCDSSNNIP